jgi:hypothetical protein
LFAARCSQKLGNHEKALADLEDIFNLNDSSALKVLKRKAFTLASASWSQIDPYPHAEIVSRLQPVVSVLSQTEVRQPDWLRIQVELANAMHLQAASVKEAGGAGSSSDSKAIDRNAARLLKTVSRIPSPHRDQAKKLLAEWNINLSVGEDAAEKPIETFFDARQKAKDYADEIGSLLNDANRLRRQVAGRPPAEREASAADLESMQLEIADKSKAALDVLELALTKADENVVRTDLNDIRYLQCFCYFASGQYFESRFTSGDDLDVAKLYAASRSSRQRRSGVRKRTLEPFVRIGCRSLARFRSSRFGRQHYDQALDERKRFRHRRRVLFKSSQTSQLSGVARVKTGTTVMVRLQDENERANCQSGNA